MLKSTRENNTGSEMTDLPDLALLNLYRSESNARALQIFFHRYHRQILGLCMYYFHDSFLAEDAAMEIFEKILELAPEYPLRNVRSWLLTVTRNHCLKHIRDRIKKENELFDKNTEIEFVEIQSESDLIDDTVLLEALDEVLDEIKEQQSLCIRLCFIQDKSYREIAQVTGFSIKEVKSYIQNGKLNLKKKLTKYKTTGDEHY